MIALHFFKVCNENSACGTIILIYSLNDKNDMNHAIPGHVNPTLANMSNVKRTSIYERHYNEIGLIDLVSRLSYLKY